MSEIAFHEETGWSQVGSFCCKRWTRCFPSLSLPLSPSSVWLFDTERFHGLDASCAAGGNESGESSRCAEPHDGYDYSVRSAFALVLSTRTFIMCWPDWKAASCSNSGIVS